MNPLQIKQSLQTCSSIYTGIYKFAFSQIKHPNSQTLNRIPLSVTMTYLPPIHKKKIFILLFLVFHFCNNLLGQDDKYPCLSQHLHMGTELDVLTHTLIDSIPSGDFYMIGETHNYFANNELLLSLMKSLQPKGVYNIVNELPHATCFLFNEYLATGNDSLLALIQPQATYNVLKAIRAMNETQEVGKKIKFYGIDYMDTPDTYNLITALKIILRRAGNDNNHLRQELSNYITKGKLNGNDILRFDTLVFKNLTGDSAAYYKAYFQNDYKDLLLMSQNFVGFKGRTDNHIYKGFQTMYHLFFEEDKKQTPKFLAFYGSFHLRKFGNKLQSEEDSPVKGKLIRIGLQYYDCYGEFPWNEEKLSTNGISFTYKKKYFEWIKEKLYQQQGMQIGILPNGNCLPSLSGNPSLDGLIFFKQYGSRRMHSWKFD